MTRDTTFWDADPNVTPLWTFRLQRAKSGEPLANLYNALVALREAPEFAGKLRYDEMLCAVVMTNGAIEDVDVFTVHEWMQTHGIRRMALEAVREAVEIVGREHPFHPVREYLHGLVWDRRYRLADWLHHYAGTDDNEYHRQIGSNFLKAMVARIFAPGCKSDYMMVLEGPQRKLKSQLCQALAGTYFSDSLPDIGSDHVRVSMHLRGKWLIEVSELSSFSRADAAKLKQFLSSAIEQFTPKYARLEVRQPRQCLFIGTTNDSAYLKDPTGGSRFWPVRCGTINLDALRHDRDQLFAEAVREFDRTKQWWPDPDIEEKLIRPEQDQRYDADAWDQPILDYLKNNATAELTLLKVAENALEFTKAQFRRSEQVRVATVMRQAGWYDRKGAGGSRIWRRDDPSG